MKAVTDSGKGLELTLLDIRLIEAIRWLKYGELHITVRDGLPRKATHVGRSLLFDQPLNFDEVELEG